MLRKKALLLALGIILVFSMFMVGGCKKAVVPGQVRVETPKKTLVVCIGQEPDSLYLYGTNMTAAAHVQTAVYDAASLPFATDSGNFAYQATITEKLPSLADGDAVIQSVTVKAGDKIIDDTGAVAELAAGMMYRPTGCASSDCAVEYDGSSEVQMDQMVVTFKIMDDVTWADGEPVKASDSVYSFNLNMDPDSPTATRYTGERTASYVATDAKTVVWTGLPGYRDSVYMGNIWIPLPEHQLGEMSALDLVTAEASSRTPMGYGPFTIIEWQSGDHITAHRNYYYYKEGLPKVDQVVFRFIGEDPNAAIAAALAGDCDILTQDISMDSVLDLLLEKEASGELAPQLVPGTLYEHIFFGVNPVEGYGSPDFFEDARTRRAIGMCLDRQSVVDELYAGRTELLATYVPSIHPLFNTDTAPVPYDPAGGQALLEEAGWIDEDGDGIREAHGVLNVEDGTPFSFTLSSTTAALRVAAMQVFQQNLAACGVDMIMGNISADELFMEGEEGPLSGRHFDAALFAFGTGVEPACTLFLSTEIPNADNGWVGQNYAGYVAPDYDVICNAAVQSLPGTPEYEQYHKEAQAYIAQELPDLALYSRLKICVARPEVTGLQMDPTNNTEMWNIENIDITE
jgi:peptide/nickel transport system substrate-binding protein